MRNFIYLIGLIGCLNVFGATGPLETIKTFDIRSYNSVDLGVRDMVFDLYISNMTEVLRNHIPTAKIKEVYFRVYYVYPGKWMTDIVGLPRGYNNLRQSLTLLIANKMEYLVPKKLGDRLRSYELKRDKKSGKIQAIDPNNFKKVNRIDLVFDKKGALNKAQSFSPVGMREVNYSYAVKSWSRNKWVLDRSTTVSTSGAQKTTTDVSIKYGVFSGFGLPKTINFSTISEMKLANQKDKKSVSKDFIMNFKNYRVNEGEAVKFMRKNSSSPPKKK